jgi:hypothetical protein
MIEVDDPEERRRELQELERETEKERQKLLAMIMEREELLEKREREILRRERELLDREKRLDETKERLLALARSVKEQGKA